MEKYLDSWLHAVGLATVMDVRPVTNDENVMNVDITFQGGELVLKVPRKYVVGQNGVPLVVEMDRVFVDIVLGITANTKTYNESTYSRLDVAIKKVLEFRKYEESKTK